MRKKINEDIVTKSHKREQKKRLRMKIHGASLRKPSPHAGKKVTSK